MESKLNAHKLVSVIIPAYNAEKFIERCLSSVKRQTYKNIEFIVVDDGSTDGTKNLCEKFISEDSRFKYYYKKNGGVSSSRNFGIERSLGEYIAFIDSDDYIDDNHIESLVSNIDGYGLSVCAVVKEDKNSAIISRQPDKEKKFTAKQAVYDMLRYSCVGRYSVNKLFLRSVIMKHNIRFDTGLAISEDTKFCFDYISNINNDSKSRTPNYEFVKYTGAATYHYIQNADSATGGLGGQSPPPWNEKWKDSVAVEWYILNGIKADFFCLCANPVKAAVFKAITLLRFKAVNCGIRLDSNKYNKNKYIFNYLIETILHPTKANMSVWKKYFSVRRVL